MNKSTFMLISALAVGIVGCDARDESQPLFGSPAEPTSTDDTSSTTVPENIDNTSDSSDSESTTSLPSAGSASSSEPQGNNPGEVPRSILAELTSLNVSQENLPRGHKIFAGNEIRGVLPGAENEVEYAYFNLTFPCVADALFESYPAPLMANTSTYMLGGFVWTPLLADSDTNVWDLDVLAILAGDDTHSIMDDDIEVYPVNWGDIIVGSTAINKLVVTRIVQYEECN